MEPVSQHTAAELIERLALTPHPEGGFYRETWRSERVLELEGYDGARNAATAILFLLRTEDSSRWHRVKSDELWMWQGGDELELSIRGSAAEAPGVELLGPGSPQALVPGGQWQAAKPRRGPHGYCLCGCVVVPGFDFADFEM